MTRPINPYIAGNSLREGKEFFGRQDTLQWVAKELNNPATNALVLAGQRRIGKTSLLLQLERTLPSDEFLPIYFDLQDKATRPLGRVLAELAGKIARHIKWKLPEPDLFDDQGQFFQNTFLPNLYQVLDKNCRPVLLLDEFDAMDQAVKEDMPENAAAKVLFSFLHSVMTEDPRPAFVFAVGRQAEDLSLDSAAIFKASLRRDIWVLDKESAELLIRNAERNGTLRFTDRAVDGILKLTSGHPYLTQLLCQRIWERAYGGDPADPPEIDLMEVQAAIPDALEMGQQVFVWLWYGLNPAEKIYAAALAEAAGQENETISEDQVIQVLMTHAPRLRTREVELAPHDLVKHWVLKKSGKQEYRFAIELIRRWVRDHKPLQEVKEELDQIDPLAEQFYVLGQQVLRREQIEAALSNFQYALDANPLHFHARLDLGEVFLRLGRVDEAVGELSRAYEQDEAEARLPLARALVAQAKIKEISDDNESALAACMRALELSPGEQEAQELRNAIWLKSGNKAMEQGELEKALTAYQQAGAKGWDEAIIFAQRTLENDPTLFRTRFHLSEVLLGLERTDAALAELDAELVVYQRASAEYKEETLVFFRGILKQESGHTLARLQLGRLLLIEGQINEALSELERAYDEDKSKNNILITFVLLTQAEAAHVFGDWLTVFSVCVRALEIDPTLSHAREVMRETIVELEKTRVIASPDAFGVNKHKLGKIISNAENHIRLLGVVALDADWRTLAQKWAVKLKDNPAFDIKILCESDNALFSKSLTYSTETIENRRSFQELQFIKDRAIIDFPDLLLEEGIPKDGERVTIEITHLPIPVSIVQVDERMFANLWLHENEDRFEEIVQTHPWYSHLEKYMDTYFDPTRGRKYACAPESELLELFDHERIPRGIYPRNSFYDTDYSQQVVWAFIFDRQGRLLIHRRADNAKDNQGMWDKSVGGHMEFDDFNNTSHAAYREVIEELFVAEPENKKSGLKKWKITDEEMIYLGEWRPEQRKSFPFKEIGSFKREWAFFRHRESERLYSPRMLSDGTERRLRVIPDVFFFVAGPQFTDKLLDELKNSTFKLLELSELKNTMDRAISGKAIPEFDKNRSGEGNPIPKFSPDLVNIMTGKLYDVLVEFSQYIKRYIRQQ